MTDIAAPTQNTLKQDSLMMALVGSAHFISHFYQLSLPPLLPLLHAEFGASYIELGSLFTVFYLVSASCQAFAGIFVDRHGARPVLLFGIVMLASCIGLLSLASHFWMFYPLMALAGLGNGVFHPADLSALSHQVSKSRLGRAYSIHAAMGRVGFAAGPLIVGSIAAGGHWRLALALAGAAGWVLALVFQRYAHYFPPGHGDTHPHAHANFSYRQIVAMPAILLALGYFFFTTAAGSGFQVYSSVSFVQFLGVPLALASAALSAYFAGSAAGMLAGGWVADHTAHHARVAVLGLVSAAFCITLIALHIFPFAVVAVLVIITGLSEGVTAPSRDILVRGAAPPGATGRVFGFVYSGVDMGAMVGPFIIGALVDAQAFRALFLGVALFYALGIPFVIPISKRQAAKQV